MGDRAGGGGGEGGIYRDQNVNFCSYFKKIKNNQETVNIDTSSKNSQLRTLLKHRQKHLSPTTITTTTTTHPPQPPKIKDNAEKKMYDSFYKKNIFSEISQIISIKLFVANEKRHEDNTEQFFRNILLIKKLKNSQKKVPFF